LKTITFLPLAAESMGTRSMCTFIETPDVRLLVDPGVALSRRWGLLPHPREYQALAASRQRIAAFADRSEVVAISHYHFDHCTPSFTDHAWTFSSLPVAEQLFHGKIVLAKDYRNNVNPSQRRRGWLLRKIVGGGFKEYHVADGNAFTFGDTVITFSPPVFHGEENTPLGWVVMTRVDVAGERVMHASDVQGPMLDATVNLILAARPDLLYLAGPPLYLVDYKVERQSIKTGLQNLATLAEAIPTVIVDHHLLRDEAWKRASKHVIEAARGHGNRVLTAAEYRGKETTLLEAQRRDLYAAEPPSSAFLTWTRLPRETQRTTMPPL